MSIFLKKKIIGISSRRDIIQLEDYIFNNFFTEVNWEGLQYGTRQKTIYIKSDEELLRIFEIISEKYDFYVKDIKTDNDYVLLDINKEDDLILIYDSIKDIFDKNLGKCKIYGKDSYIKCDKKLENCDKTICDIQYYITIKQKCAELLKISDKTQSDEIITEFCERLIEEPEKYLSILFIIDTFHDIFRVKFFNSVYKELTGRDFLDDYLIFLTSKNINPNIVRNLINKDSIEVRIFTTLIKYLLSKNKNYEKQSFKTTNSKIAVDVWLERKKLSEDYKFRNIYPSLFDSNPTNSSYNDDKEDQNICSSLMYNIIDKKIIYFYNIDNGNLNVSFKNFSKNIKNIAIYGKTIKYSPKNITEQNQILKNKLSELILYFNSISKGDIELKKKIEKLVSSGVYKLGINVDDDSFEYKGNTNGPSISDLCVIILLSIRDGRLKSSSNIFKYFDNIESLLTIKRAGDFGQIILSKKIDYIFATNDYLQACFGLLNGNKMIVTCGDIKYYETDMSLDSTIESVCINQMPSSIGVKQSLNQSSDIDRINDNKKRQKRRI